MITIKILVFLTYIFSVLLLETKDFKNYGPYTIIWEEFTLCAGPKRFNLSDVTVGREKGASGYVISLNVTYRKPTPISEIKITAHTMKQNRRVLVWSYRNTAPCKHYYLIEQFSFFKDVATCTISQGTFALRYNLTELSSKLLGPKFFYGHYYIKIISLSKTGNLCCFTATVITKKKNS